MVVNSKYLKDNFNYVNELGNLYIIEMLFANYLLYMLNSNLCHQQLWLACGLTILSNKWDRATKGMVSWHPHEHSLCCLLYDQVVALKLQALPLFLHK
jgi:hypothetical protein